MLLHATQLRRSDNDNVREHVYINRDLTKAQAQAAYEVRCRRHAALAKRQDRNHNPSPEDSGRPAAIITHVSLLNPSARDFQPSTGRTED